ncbi:MAG TPA: cyclase family protein [Thermodesulfobacteriota bacterium]|nr:cyclase family protein [Thermodesulfobacteriota bacterium]
MTNIIKAALIVLAVLVSADLARTAFSEENALSFPKGEWIDLTHDFSSDTVYWPTGQGFRLEKVFEGTTDKGYFYAANKYTAEEHGGTHIDAPEHFGKGKQTVDEIPLEHLIGSAVVIDVSKKAASDRDYQICVEDFTEWESANGRIPAGSIVLLDTGYAKYWPDKVKYMGTDKKGQEAVKELHFPGLDPAAAKWLIENRSISAVGLDTPSIDYGQSTLFESHRTLFEHNVPAFENVANLDRLPAKGALVIALPMKIKGGSGGPLRIVALIPAGN